MNCKRPLEAVRRLEVAQKRLDAAARHAGGLAAFLAGRAAAVFEDVTIGRDRARTSNSRRIHGCAASMAVLATDPEARRREGQTSAISGLP